MKSVDYSTMILMVLLVSLYLPINPDDRNLYLDGDYSIGLIVGPSGSGKSSLLEQFGKEEKLDWDQDKSVASHFERC
jgi:putative ribosome biogenesis GTPase RsgA